MSKQNRPDVEKTLPRCTNILPDGTQCTAVAGTMHHLFWPKKDFKEAPSAEDTKADQNAVKVFKKLPDRWQEITGWTRCGQIKAPVCFNCHQRVLNVLFELCYNLIQRKGKCDYDKGNACLECFRWYDKHPEDTPHLLQIINKPKPRGKRPPDDPTP